MDYSVEYSNFGTSYLAYQQQRNIGTSSFKSKLKLQNQKDCQLNFVVQCTFGTPYFKPTFHDIFELASKVGEQFTPYTTLRN